MKNLLSLWAFLSHCDTIHVLPDNQLSNSTIQRYLYRLNNHFLTLKKIEVYQINIYIFSFNAAPNTGKKKLFYFPKLQASTF